MNCWPQTHIRFVYLTNQIEFTHYSNESILSTQTNLIQLELNQINKSLPGLSPLIIRKGNN